MQAKNYLKLPAGPVRSIQKSSVHKVKLARSSLMLFIFIYIYIFLKLEFIYDSNLVTAVGKVYQNSINKGK